MPDNDELALPALAGGSAVTVGAFDGVHSGHHDVLAALDRKARALAVPSVLVTFHPHPLAVVNPSAAPRLLTPGDERGEALAGDVAPGYTVVIPFTAALAGFAAERFVRERLLRAYRMRSLVIGYDHGLGRGRAGDAATLVAMGRTLGFDVEVVPPRIGLDGLPISSTAIRRAIAYGDLAAARAALGRRYSVRGRVVPGANRGRSLGFPTINLRIAAEKLLPPDGVYAVRVSSVDGEHGAMMHLGGRPTFGESERSLEAHVFDVAGDWYGRDVALEFVRRMRDVLRFESVEALTAQLRDDAVQARAALTQP